MPKRSKSRKRRKSRKRKKSRKKRGGAPTPLYGFTGMSSNEIRPTTAYQIQKQKIPNWSLSRKYEYQRNDPWGFEAFKDGVGEEKNWDTKTNPILFKGYLSKKTKKAGKRKSRKKRRRSRKRRR